MTFSPFVRQVFVAVTTQLASISMGGSVVFPCVLLQQFEADDSDIKPDLDTATWIASVHGLAGIPSVFMPILMQYIGRKLAFMLSCLILNIGWILSTLTREASTLIVTESLSGFGSNCISVVGLMSVSEMMAPKHRNVYMVILGINQMFGTFICTFLGYFLHWKTVARIMCCPSILALCMAFKWPESPAWLAHKGHYDKCETAFIWLRGSDKDSIKELKTLIAAQKENHKRSTFNDILRKDFYIPNFLMLLMLLNIYMLGSLAFYTYTFKIIESATDCTTFARIGYLFTNAMLFVGSLICLFLLRFFDSKSILIFIESLCIICHLFSSILLYLESIGVLSKQPLLFMCSFLGFSAFVSCGLVVITFATCTELMPVRHKGIGGILYIVYTCSLVTLTLKLLPYIIKIINLWGTFLICAVNGTIGLILIRKYVPVTKNRTLQEIEEYYNYGTFERVRDVEDGDTLISENKT